MSPFTKMLRRQLIKIFENVQSNSGCHPQNLQQLLNIFEQNPLEIFLSEFVMILQRIFMEEINQKNLCVERTLTFAAQFLAKMTDIPPEENENDTETDIDSNKVVSEPDYHPVFTLIIKKLLEFHDLEFAKVRYHTCMFLSLVLNHVLGKAIGEETCLSIQEAMFVRLNDPKISVRVQAIHVLTHLQQPDCLPCPVINKFLNLLEDPRACIRFAVLEKIAPLRGTLSSIVQYVRDTDFAVRNLAFKKTAEFHPKYLTAFEKQTILTVGVQEETKIIRKTFEQSLLLKWGTAYGNTITFFNSLYNQNANMKSLLDTYKLSERLIEQVYKMNPRSVTDALVLTSEKLPSGEINFSTVTYWSLLFDLLKAQSEDKLSDIQPDVIPLCHLIDSYLESNQRKNVERNQRKRIDFILEKLFHIVESCDLTDEASRQYLKNFIQVKLLNFPFKMNVVSQMLKVLSKLIENVNNLIEDICHIVSDIKRDEISEDTFMDNNSRIITKRCMTLLISLMKLPAVHKMTPLLESYKDDYMVKVLKSENRKISLLGYTGLAYTIILKQRVEKSDMIFLCNPILLYRVNAINSNGKIIVAIKTITHLLLMWGSKIFECVGGNYNVRKKNVYAGTNDGLIVNVEAITCEETLDVIADMLNDDDYDLRETAVSVFFAILKPGIPVAPHLITRLILKWFNWTNDQTNARLYQLLVRALQCYTSKVKESASVMEEVIIPVLNSYGTRPLTCISSDAVVKFLAIITSPNPSRKHFDNTHENFIFIICRALLNKPNDVCANLWVKMLFQLVIPIEKKSTLQRIKNEIENILLDIVDRHPKNNLLKYLAMITRIENETEIEMNGTRKSLPLNEKTPTRTKNKQRAEFINEPAEELPNSKRLKTPSIYSTGSDMSLGPLRALISEPSIASSNSLDAIEPSQIRDKLNGDIETTKTPNKTNSSSTTRSQNKALNGTQVSNLTEVENRFLEVETLSDSIRNNRNKVKNLSESQINKSSQNMNEVDRVDRKFSRIRKRTLSSSSSSVKSSNRIETRSQNRSKMSNLNEIESRKKKVSSKNEIIESSKSSNAENRLTKIMNTANLLECELHLVNVLHENQRSTRSSLAKTRGGNSTGKELRKRKVMNKKRVAGTGSESSKSTTSEITNSSGRVTRFSKSELGKVRKYKKV